VTRKALALAVAVIAVSATARAEIPAAALQRLKDATVLISAAGMAGAVSGSGFVLSVKGKQAYIVTNAHTTEILNRPAATITVVFRSGQPGEKQVVARVAGRDRQRDLAVLTATIDNPPAPLATPKNLALRETMEVYIVGFPFGRALALVRASPAVTIGKGAVSSLRRDPAGRLVAIQIDGDVNPGNSGGPIVTAQGELVGICVAKVEQTGIGWAIPPEDLHEMLAGQAGEVLLKQQGVEGDAARVLAEADLIDPMENLRTIHLLLTPVETIKATPQPQASGRWRRLAEHMTARPLSREGGQATASFLLPLGKGERTGYFFQVETVDRAGTRRYTEPRKAFLARESTSASSGSSPTADPDDWLGDLPAEDPAKEGPAVPTVRRASRQPLAGTRYALDGAIATAVNAGKIKLLPALLCPAADGKSFFLGEPEGVIRKITLPGLVEERVIDTKHPCSAIAMCSEGLIAVCPTLQEVWLLSSETLAVRTRVALSGTVAAAAAPASSAVAIRIRPELGDEVLAIVDMPGGRLRQQTNIFRLQAQAGSALRRHAGAGRLKDLAFLTMSPDGKELLCLSEGSLHRFALTANGVEYREAGPRIGGTNPRRIEISADSKYVAMVTGAGNPPVDDHPKVGYYCTYIYGLSNLQMPVTFINQGAYPTSLIFDRPHRCLYSQNADAQVIRFAINGRKEKSWAIPDAGRTERLIMVPGGAMLLVMTDRSLYSLSFDP